MLGFELFFSSLLVAKNNAKDRMSYKRTTWNIPGRRGLIQQKAKLVWLLPHEVQVDDAPALRHEFPQDSEES
jgi:hypothetical protein